MLMKDISGFSKDNKIYKYLFPPIFLEPKRIILNPELNRYFFKHQTHGHILDTLLMVE